VRERFLALIERHLEAENGAHLEVELAVAPPQSLGRQREGMRSVVPRPERPESQRAPARVASPASSRTPSRREPTTQQALPYRFENFVVGPCNALAREACFAVANESQRGLNPPFLSADAGLGKTHLARPITTTVRAGGSSRVIYASAESFTNDFMSAIRGKQMEGFKQRYRNACRLLVLEEVQFLKAKRATQLELFHTLCHLLDVGAQVVLTGDRLPRDVEGLGPRLRSQMSAGLVAELEPPDAVVRREILRQKAASGGVRLPDDCRELIVESVRGSVRDLEGVLIQLVATASLLKRPIDQELTRAALHKLQPGRDAHRLGPSEVLEAVATFFRTRPGTLAGRSRRRDVLWPRQLAMYLCCRYTDEPTAAIARVFGRRHTAVANAEKVISRAILERAPLRYKVEAISERLDQLENEARQRSAQRLRPHHPSGRQTAR